MERRNTKRMADFTLIELLVVIAIIAILAAMLLPSLGKAKDTAIESQCRANKKTVSTALIIYADDFKETMPPYHDNSIMWQTVANPYIKDPAGGPAEKSILHCPADKATPRFWATRNTAINGSMYTGLSWNGRTWPQSAGATLRMFSEVAFPTELCLVGDGCGQDYSSEWGEGARYYNVWAGNVYTYTRHNGFDEVAYFDGHCRAMASADLLREAAAAGTTSRFFDWDASDTR